jgi:hypothetical protein
VLRFHRSYTAKLLGGVASSTGSDEEEQGFKAQGEEMRKKMPGGVFVARKQNHLFRNHGLQKRDVPHSVDTITIMRIMDTWQPFPAKISETEWETERFEEGQTPKID